MSLETDINKLIENYISLFEQKQGVKFQGWINGVTGQCAMFDQYRNIYFHHIKYDIDNGLYRGLIFDWLTWCVETDNDIEYSTWHKM